MNLKRTFWSILVIMLFSASCGRAQESSSEEEILKMVKSFYTSYISENSKMPTNVEKINLIKRKYCTKNLIDKIEKQELDYDPFLNAQDTDVEWLKTLTVSRYDQQGNTYTVSYIDSYENKKITIKLKVIKKDGTFKIDSIL